MLSRHAFHLPSGVVHADAYLPATCTAAPLVLVVHGLLRSKTNMAGWGSLLETEGLATVIPDLPAWFDPARNGRSIGELIELLRQHPIAPFDPQRIGLLGFSAGGLATLLAAADNPAIGIWVGLDPVDQHKMGQRAAAKLACRAVILRAEPSRCNAHGNAAAIELALRGPCWSLRVKGARHLDAEWPTDWLAEWLCGRSSEARRAVFARYALAALKAHLMDNPAAKAVLDRASSDNTVVMGGQP